MCLGDVLEGPGSASVMRLTNEKHGVAVESRTVATGGDASVSWSLTSRARGRGVNL